MERITKTDAKKNYLLADSDLTSLYYTTKMNYLNSNNSIKLYKKLDVLEIAKKKHGTIELLEKKKEEKEQNKKNKKNTKIDNKENKKKLLLDQFHKNNYYDDIDILSEYPCYLYVEYSEKKFLDEVENKINYNINNIYEVASTRINKRNLLMIELEKVNIKYNINDLIFNNFIDGYIKFNELLNYIKEIKFFNNDKLFKIIIQKDNIKNKSYNIIKTNIIYYYLILNKKQSSFPNFLNNIIQTAIKTIFFIEEHSNNIISKNKTNKISYQNYKIIIHQKNIIINNIYNKNISIPDYIFYDRLNNYDTYDNI